MIQSRSLNPVPHRSRGFSLVELMVGLTVGLVATVVVVQVLSFAEGQKRSTTSGADAQVSGALALYAIQRDVQMAGYGFSSSPGSLGCALAYSYKGAAIAGFPAALVPVSITQGAGGAPDSLRVLFSNKISASTPTRIIPPGYDPAVMAKSKSFPVMSSLGIKQSDLLLAVTDGVSTCSLFQATADGSTGSVPRADDGAGWNTAGRPVTAYADGSYLVNLGQLTDHVYDINPTTNALRVTAFGAATASYAANDLQPGIVQLKAMYGKCSTCTATTIGPIDSFDNTTPTTNAGWLQVRAIRVALVARSTQYEKDVVTSADQVASGLLWDVGSATPVNGTATTTCHGTSKCVTLKLDTTATWQHYRYKVYDTLIPLRNVAWKS
jgi:type IV pilus assembly protein PilW